MIDAVILNPLSGGGRGAKRWEHWKKTPQAVSLGIEKAAIWNEKPDGHWENLAGWILDQHGKGSRRFVVAGGDGTIHAAVNAILKAEDRAERSLEIVLGALGLGSSNDFHKKDTPKVLSSIPERLNFSGAFAHDLGSVCFEGRRIFFVLNASLGVTAEGNDYFNRGSFLFRLLKKLSIDSAIVAAAIRQMMRFKPTAMQIKVGETTRNVGLVNLGIVKNRFFSGALRYDVGAQPADGQFWVHLAHDMSRAEMMRAFVGLSQGKFLHRPKTWSSRAHAVEVSSTNSFAVEADGEVYRTTSVGFELVAKRLIFCP